METAAGFDVVAVVHRAVSMNVLSASSGELVWADRAASLLRTWVDAWQAEVQFQLTLPPPLPPEPDSEPATPPVPTPFPESEPLPSLGSGGSAESPQERLRMASRSQLLADLPAFREALAVGRIKTAHVDLLAAAVDKLSEAIRIRVLARGEELLRVASACTADRFGRTIARVIAKAYDDEGLDRTQRQRAQSGLRRGVDQASGMHWLHLDIDPERGVEMFQRLDHEREAIFRRGEASGLSSAQLELRAVLNLLGAPGAQQRSSTKKAHVSVIVDIETLLYGAHDRTVCESWSGVQMPPDSVRNLICAAELSFGFTMSGRVVCHLANAELATPDQRRELRMMYRTCCGPSCGRRFDHCQVHHVIPRCRAGPTATPLMVPLCQECHDKIHHGGWKIAIDRHRTITWTAPDGADQVHPYVPLADQDQPSLFDPDQPAP